MMKIVNLGEVPEHIATLAQWHHAEWSRYNPDENLSQRVTRMQDYLGSAFIPSTFIAEEDELLGSAAIVENDMDTRTDLSPWLASVYVEPSKRGKGIGSKLVLHLMEAARSYDISTLYLFTPDKQNFYKRLGWEIVGKEIYHDEAVTIMKTPLIRNT